MATNARHSHKVLISYAHENDEHRRRVARFAELLTDAGIDIVIDRVAEAERQDWAGWTLAQIAEAERVLIVASPEYRQRFEGTGPPDVGRGVQFEGLIIRDEIYRDQRAGLRKFVPVLLDGARREDIPKVLLPFAGQHYRITELSQSGVATVVNLLRAHPAPDPGSTGSSRGDEEDQRHAALHLRTLGGTPDARHSLLGALQKTAGREGVLCAASADSASARLVAPPDVAVRILGRVTRAIQDLLATQRPPASPRLRIEIGAHISDHAIEAIDIAEQLAHSDVTRRMHAVRRGEFVVATSSEFRAALGRAQDSRLPIGSFQECLDAGPDGRSCWVAVPGHRQPPALPDAPPPDLLPPAEPDAAAESPRSVHQSVTAGNIGILSQPGRDAHMTFNFGQPR
jgi:SEFIR domain